MRQLIFALSAVLVATACNTSDFSGRARQRGGENLEPQPPATTPPQEPVGQIGDNPPEVVNVPPEDKPLINFSEFIDGIIDFINDVEISQTDETEIVFGGDKVFHIGDANFSSDSECASEIHAYKLKGTQYFFEFEVVEANTVVDISVNKICGIDYDYTNTVHLQDMSSDLEQKALPRRTEDMQFGRKMLQPGKYMVVVESKQAGAQNPSMPTDFDDFIVGEVHISADKTIRPGQVGAK